MEGMLKLEPEDHQVIAHLRALDASHRQLLEALTNAVCALEVCGKDFDHAMGNARTAIAAAKDLT